MRRAVPALASSWDLRACGGNMTDQPRYDRLRGEPSCSADGKVMQAPPEGADRPRRSRNGWRPIASGRR